MEFYEVIEKRRTIRDFSDKEVSAEILKRILEAGMKAPSNDHFLYLWYPTETIC